MDFESIQSSHQDSGIALPLVFQEKLKDLERQEGKTINRPYSLASSGGAVDSDAVFTVAELEEKLRTTSHAIVNLQKQIARGEESYYDETQQAHGSSLFKGYDTFIDSRIDSFSDGNGGSRSNHGSTTRRMPGDFRWFSSSCNVAKYIKTTNVGVESALSMGTGLDGASSTDVPLQQHMSAEDMMVKVVTLTKQEHAESRKRAKKQKTEHASSQEHPQSPQPAAGTATSVPASSEKKRPLEKEGDEKDDPEPPSQRAKKEEKTEAVSKNEGGGSKKNTGKVGRGRPSRKRKSVS